MHADTCRVSDNAYTVLPMNVDTCQERKPRKYACKVKGDSVNTHVKRKGNRANTHVKMPRGNRYRTITHVERKGNRVNTHAK